MKERGTGKEKAAGKRRVNGWRCVDVFINHNRIGLFINADGVA